MTRNWSQENQQRILALRKHYPQKFNVCIGILVYNITGPLLSVIDENLNVEKYLTILRNHVTPAVRRLGSEVNFVLVSTKCLS